MTTILSLRYDTLIDIIAYSSKLCGKTPYLVSILTGLFNPSHMEYEENRPNDIAGEPSLAEMVDKAIRILQKNDNGFFLQVEGNNAN